MNQDIYGELEALRKYCGKDIQWGGRDFFWSHGWNGPEYNVDYRHIFYPYFEWSEDRIKRTTILVHREDQALVLKDSGFHNVAAIGSPFCYIEKPNLSRVSNSLLVMPIHSHVDWPQNWNEEPYVDYIRSLSSKFSSVTVCCHEQCFKTGTWVNRFRDAGFKVVPGATYDDSSSNTRLAQIFASHDFMNTNGYGSHWVYAAYFGCKVSVSDHYQIFDFREFSTNPLKFPALVKKYGWKSEQAELTLKSMEMKSRENMEALYPFLFSDPWNAVDAREWASFQLGIDSKRQPTEIPSLFNYKKQIYFYKKFRYFISKLIRGSKKTMPTLSSRS